MIWKANGEKITVDSHVCLLPSALRKVSIMVAFSSRIFFLFLDVSILGSIVKVVGTVSKVY